MMPKIFVSYRRVDSEIFAHRIADWFVLKYGEDNVFIDIDAIKQGENFPDKLRRSVQESDVMLVIIGKTWAAEFAQRDPDGDFVLLEVQRGLAGVPLVIPVLLDDTPFPTTADLPEAAHGLLTLNAARVRRTDFHRDMDDIHRTIQANFARRRGLIPLIAVVVTLVIAGLIFLLATSGTATADAPQTFEAMLNEIEAENTAVVQAPLSKTRTIERVETNADWTPVEREFNGVEMVLVPAGCFMMGSEDGNDNEQPIHEICFDEPFWIDKYEVTNEQYGSVSPLDSCLDWSSEPDQPRNCVDWFDASDFCKARGGRLPTEAEWEYAARGPDALVYPWGNDYDAGLVIGRDDPTYGDTRTAPVGSRPAGASWVGAMDMSGNLWEWISSLNIDYPYGDDHESDSDTSGLRVLRGGSFFDSRIVLRSAVRGGNDPDYFSHGYGFRCARDVTPEDTPPTETATVIPETETVERVETNADWTPVEREFETPQGSTVTMVLVPPGSFEMGSTEEEIEFGFEMCQQAADNDAECQRSWFENEAPNGDNTQTFTEPFWIDRTEVTRAQYQQCMDAGVCEETFTIPDSLELCTFGRKQNPSLR